MAWELQLLMRVTKQARVLVERPLGLKLLRSLIWLRAKDDMCDLCSLPGLIQDQDSERRGWGPSAGQRACLLGMLPRHHIDSEDLSFCWACASHCLRRWQGLRCLCTLKAVLLLQA